MSPLIASADPSVVSTTSSVTLNIIPPALMFISTLLSAVLLLLSSPFNRYRAFPNALLALNTVLPAIAATLCVDALLNRIPRFEQFSLVFWTLHGCLLSMSSLYVLFVASTKTSLVQRAFRFMSAFSIIVLTCEIIAGSITTAPALLAPIFALTSRGLLLPFSVGVFCDVRRATYQSTVAPSANLPEQHCDDRLISTNFPRRVSSPNPDTWPFPASLAQNHSSYDSITPKGPTERLHLVIVILTAQTAAVICATFTISLVVISGNAPSWIILQTRDLPRTSQYAARRSGSLEATDVVVLSIVRSVCSLIWAVAVVTALYLLPSVKQSSQASLKLAGCPSSRHSEFTVIRTPNPSHSRSTPSDSASDFLSMRDPFASSLPRPAQLNVGLGLGLERGVAPQYRFPAPKTKKAKGKRKARMRTRGETLEYQASTKTLLPRCPHAAHTSEVDCSLKDEVQLAQLLLQSLVEHSEMRVEHMGPASVAAANYSLSSPQPTARVQPRLGSGCNASTALSVTASTSWCEKKPMTSISTSECAHRIQGKDSETRKSTDTGASISTLPQT